MATITKQTPLHVIESLSKPCQCDACSVGCKFGSGFLADEDIPRIAKFLGLSEQELKEKHLGEVQKFHTARFRPKTIKSENPAKPYGPCTFFDENGCIIQKVKPLHCRIASGCNGLGEQIDDWFHLNYFVNPGDPQSMREWNERVKHRPTIPGGNPEDLVKDKKTLKKMLNYKLMI